MSDGRESPKYGSHRGDLCVLCKNERRNPIVISQPHQHIHATPVQRIHGDRTGNMRMLMWMVPMSR